MCEEINMKNNFQRVIVAHPGQQHSFHMASALKSEGILLKYITTVYDKEKSFTRFIKRWLKGDNLKRASSRSCAALSPDDVVQFCEWQGLLLILLDRIEQKHFFYNKLENHIRHRYGIKVAKYAIKNKADAIVLYDTNALYAGRYLTKIKSDIVLIMDVAAANREYIRAIYEKDRELCPKFADKLFAERQELWNVRTFSQLKEESRYIDHFIVPSHFVEKSLLYSNIKEEQIHICPYGSNYEIDDDCLSEHDLSSPLNLVYIGTVSAMKGVWYMLEAVKRFPKEKVTLKLIGSYDNASGVFDHYFDRCNFVGLVTHDRIKDLCKDADVFIFPSLGDGFGLAALEALSFGLPCIVTENTD